MVERRPHRDRVGVVAVVHEDDPVRRARRARPRRREKPIRGADRPSRRAARRAPHPAAIAASALSGCGPRRRGSGSAARRPASRSAPRSPPSSTRASAAATSPPAPKRSSLGARSRCGSSAPASAGTTAVPPGRQAVEDLGLGRRDRLDRAEQLDVDRADVGDHADVGLGDRASSAIWPGPRIAISSTSSLGVRGAASTVSGRPISVLKFSRVGVDARRAAAPGRCP